MIFSNLLIKWYLQNKRDLPWRNSTNPYFIWLSEIMLQQTRVAQGTPYFVAFSTAFPTVFDLANADEREVLKLWQGLGYYSRARNLHKTAQYVANNLGGLFPDNYASLLELKGVGTYTAAAIASFCYGESVPVVDGNVFRVLSRHYGITTDIALASAKTEFAELAFELMDKENAAIFNQAIMEFGALQCVPKNPNCSICVFNQTCKALQNDKIAQLPFKSKKTKVSKRYFNYLVASDDCGNTLACKRTDAGIWQNLYEFPLVETKEIVDFDFMDSEIRTNFFKKNAIESIEEYNPKPILHKLSHQHLYIKFWKIQLSGQIKNGISIKELRQLPFPIVIHNFIESCLFV